VPAWRYALASVQGTSHLKANVPCQDHAQIATIPAFGPPRALIAVAADGAGSASRSDEGARSACSAFLEFSRLALDWVCAAEHLTDSFGKDALADLQADVASLARDLNEPVSSFACTLLGALVTADAALFVQLGDGAIVYRVASDTAWCLAAPGQRGEFVNETIFVTRSDASQYLQAIRVNEPICEFALMTDGVEFLAIKQPEGIPHKAFFEHVTAGLRAIPDPGEASGHNDWIERFLESKAVNSRTDDDKTLVLATRDKCPVRR
jgi:hypothetical protein